MRKIVSTIVCNGDYCVEHIGVEDDVTGTSEYIGSRERPDIEIVGEIGCGCHPGGRRN